MTKARDLASASIVPAAVSVTELGYIDGVTSAIQTQMDTKAATAATINPTIVDAKGDLIAATAADAVSRLAVGADNTVLTADSTVATGMKWSAPSSGAMTLIKRATFTAVSNTGTTFDNMFSSTYGSYYITFQKFFSADGGSDLHFQFRRSGPTTQTAGYTQNRLEVNDTTTTITNVNTSGQSEAKLNTNIGSLYDGSDGHIFIFGASGASERPVYSAFLSNANTAVFANTYGYVSGPNVYTGFILTASLASITGTCSVYGMAVA
jgi:hypothetical protein